MGQTGAKWGGVELRKDGDTYILREEVEQRAKVSVRECRCAGSKGCKIVGLGRVHPADGAV